MDQMEFEKSDQSNLQTWKIVKFWGTLSTLVIAVILLLMLVTLV